ncbi:MAG: hypothetical protein WBD81_21595 [Collimonas pratensis]|uniref:hypothetical protein n=1 Tax=Collimonas pratensis TaxID=279113 RepID=UPI003C736A58
MPYSLAKKLIASTAATLVIITVAATAFMGAIYQWEPELLFRQENAQECRQDRRQHAL